MGSSEREWPRILTTAVTYRNRFRATAWVVRIRPQSWERHGLKPWVEAAKKRLHHNVLAIALANKLARIAWAVLNKERNFEVMRTTAPASQPGLCQRRSWGDSCLPSRSSRKRSGSILRPLGDTT
jgi:hypothetical protein